MPVPVPTPSLVVAASIWGSVVAGSTAWLLGGAWWDDTCAAVAEGAGSGDWSVAVPNFGVPFIGIAWPCVSARGDGLGGAWDGFPRASASLRGREAGPEDGEPHILHAAA